MKVKVWLGYNYKGKVDEGEAWRMAMDFIRPVRENSVWEGLGRMLRMQFEDGSAVNLSLDEEAGERPIERYLHVSTISYTDSLAKACMDQMAESFEELGIGYSEYTGQGLAPGPMLHRVWKLSHD